MKKRKKKVRIVQSKQSMNERRFALMSSYILSDNIEALFKEMGGIHIVIPKRQFKGYGKDRKAKLMDCIKKLKYKPNNKTYAYLSKRFNMTVAYVKWMICRLPKDQRDAIRRLPKMDNNTYIDNFEIPQGVDRVRKEIKEELQKFIKKEK